jgi:hypothetical protein
MEDRKARLKVVAEGLARLERESQKRSALATPGQNIERTLELSELIRKSESTPEKPLPVSMVALWRARRRAK